MAINTITGNTLLTSGSFPPARAASTGSALNPSVGGLLTVDGITLVAGDRVLCKDEASAVNNGIYAASTGPWVRTSDAAGNQNFFSGMAVTVALGAVNAGLTYICTTTDDPVVIGTSNITFAAQGAVATATQTATSTTSLTVGTGSKTLTIQSGKAFLANQYVVIYETSNTANAMLAQVTSYSGTSLVVNVTATGGSGTHTDWTVVLLNSAAAAGISPPVGSGNVTGPGSSTTGHLATFADGTGKVLQDGGAPVGGGGSIVTAMLSASAAAFGLNMLNGQLVASVGSSALTIAVKTLAGNDPSASDTVLFVFRSATASSGALTVINVNAALSVTVPASSTLGFSNATPGRIWIAAINNAGTVSLAVINCLSVTGSPPTAASIYPLAGWGIVNVTAFGGGANNAQVFYGAGTLSGVAYGVLGYAAWETGGTLATAGTWSAGPTRLEMYRPGVALPGQQIQINSAVISAASTTTSTTFVALSSQTISITPTSSANPILVSANGSGAEGTAQIYSLKLSRGTTAATNMIGNECVFGSANAPAMMTAYDFPASLSSVTYAVQGKTNAATLTYNSGGTTSVMSAQELQG